MDPFLYFRPPSDSPPPLVQTGLCFTKIIGLPKGGYRGKVCLITKHLKVVAMLIVTSCPRPPRLVRGEHVQLVRHRGPHVDHDAVDVVLLLRAEPKPGYRGGPGRPVCARALNSPELGPEFKHRSISWQARASGARRLVQRARRGNLSARAKFQPVRRSVRGATAAGTTREP